MPAPSVLVYCSHPPSSAPPTQGSCGPWGLRPPQTDALKHQTPSLPEWGGAVFPAGQLSSPHVWASWYLSASAARSHDGQQQQPCTSPHASQVGPNGMTPSTSPALRAPSARWSAPSPTLVLSARQSSFHLDCPQSEAPTAFLQKQVKAHRIFSAQAGCGGLRRLIIAAHLTSVSNPSVGRELLVAAKAVTVGKRDPMDGPKPGFQ